MDESYLAGNCSSEDVPNQKRKRQKPARYQTESDTEIVKSERVTDSDSESVSGKRHKTPEVPKNNDFDSSTSKHIIIVPNLKRRRKKPTRYQSESSDPESESNFDHSVNTYHLNGNCSEDVPKQNHKRQKPAMHQIDSNGNELIQVKSERLSDLDSESDSVFDSSKRHKLSNLPESNKLGSNNTSRHSSTSQDDVSNCLSSSEMEQAALSFEERVIRWMEKTERELESQTHTLNLILALLRSRTVERDPMMADDIPKLPLRTKEEMDYFEAYLENSSNFNKMVVYLSGKGGHTVQETTRRIFNAIMATELLSIYNWAGRGKIAFKNTATKQLIIYAVRKNKNLENASEKVMEEEMKSVMKYAPLRVRYAEQRK